jgi:glycosyltransferase involved in cell wall biosynthesis
MSTPAYSILKTCFSRSWGGLELQALETTTRLRERGHRIWLASPPGSRLEQEAVQRSIPTIPLNVRGYLHPALAWRLASFLRTQDVDIIHAELSKDLATLVPAMKMSGRPIPIVLTKGMGSYISKRDMLHQFTYASVSRVIAISEVIRANVLDTTPMTPERVVTLHNAVDTGLFSPERGRRQHVRRSVGLDDATVVIGFVGRFSPGKGLEELLQAAGMLRSRYTKMHVLVAGEASYGEEEYAAGIRTLAHTLDLDTTVTFAGFRSDIPELMSAFDIFAFPSHAEAFGMVLIEAMAMERPVVSTNCDGVLEIVVDGETGLYVHPRNPKELAEALATLIDDPDRRAAMGRAGRLRVLRLFDQRKQLARMEEIYQEVLREQAAKQS